MELNSQIVQTVNSAFMEKINPELQGSIGELGIGLRTKVDLQSAGLDRNIEGDKMTSNWPKSGKETDNLNRNIKEGPSNQSDRDYDS